MPSPFPGMNPYLEQDDVWHDFHKSFVPRLSDVLSEQVSPIYFVKIEGHTYVHDIPPDAGRLIDVDHESVSYLQIRDRKNREVVTAIELLSPSNKQPGRNREQYIGKRQHLLASSVHLVEIDLLRGGARMPADEMPECDYCVLVSRMERRPRVGVWPIQLRDQLPTIPVPLRPEHPDARVDLQQVLHGIYDAARYGDYIYEGEPEPPLSPDDEPWARSIVQATK